jgi:hypothetical protein
LEVKIDDSVKWGWRIYYGQTENKLELEKKLCEARKFSGE